MGVAGGHARATQRRYARRAVAAVAAMCASAVVVAALRLGWLAVGVEAVLIVGMLALVRHVTPLIARWSRGAQGEEHVGAILDGMRDDGWFALHDVSVGRGNIDHILIGPAGIFTIETKSHPGRISVDRIDPRMLKQAYAEAKVVERITGMGVKPLLVFSRAYLMPAICRREGVLVLPARMLAGHLARREAALAPAEVQALHARFAAAFASG
jgi:hypothetical protein